MQINFSKENDCVCGKIILKEGNDYTNRLDFYNIEAPGKYEK